MKAKLPDPIRYHPECVRCGVKFRGASACCDPKCIRATNLVNTIQAKGSDAMDARDAAHEACHALMWGVKKKWTRDNIHAVLIR